MPNCFVPGCRSQSRRSRLKPKEEISTKRHLFQVKAANIHEWAKLIPHPSKCLTNKCVICDVHFEEHHIKKHYLYVINGEQVKTDRLKWELTLDAKPTLFLPNLHLRSETIPVSTTPQKQPPSFTTKSTGNGENQDGSDCMTIRGVVSGNGESRRDVMGETEQVEADKEADPCKKYFLNNFDLAQHIRTRIGEEHSYCQKGFAQGCDLKPQRTELEQLEIKKEYNLCQFFGCPVCHKVFPTKDILKRHLQTTGCNVKSSDCSDCHKIFENETTDTLKDHLFTRFGAKPYVCEVYKQTFWLKTKLKAHFKTHQGDKPYTCKVENEYNLKDHHSTHFGAKPYPCKVCQQTFSAKSDLEVHFLCHRPTEGKQTHSGEETSKETTSKETTTKSTEPEPLEIKKDDNRCQIFSCPVCHEAFATNNLLKWHLQITRCNVKTSSCCSVCYKNVKGKSNLKDHLFTHFGSKPSACEVYKETFLSKTDLKGHLLCHGPTRKKRTHSGEETCKHTTNKRTEPEQFEIKIEDNPCHTFSCLVCHEVLMTKNLLKRHLRTTGCNLKSFQCSVCYKIFKNESNFKDHLLTHFGVKPYACEVCKETFWVKTNLKTHHEEKQYKCEECQKEFNCKFNLKCHLNTHSAKKQYKCKVCHKLFKTESTLRSHRQAHTNCVKPYPCDIAYFLDVLCKVEI